MRLAFFPDKAAPLFLNSALSCGTLKEEYILISESLTTINTKQALNKKNNTL